MEHRLYRRADSISGRIVLDAFSGEPLEPVESRAVIPSPDEKIYPRLNDAEAMRNVYDEYMTADDSGKPHKFPVSIRLTIKPRGATCDASVKVSYGVKKVAEADCATPTDAGCEGKDGAK